MSDALLKVEGLSCFAGTQTLLQDVSFSLSPGRILCLLGPNGSGKSTLLKVLSGVVSERTLGIRGTAQMGAQSLLTAQQSQRADLAVYLGPDLHTEFPLTAGEVVEMGGRNIESAMRKTACWDLRGRPLRTLSNGERQRVALARAFAQDPQCLFLDEALSQLDLHHQRMVGDLLVEWVRPGKAVILVAHDLSLGLAWAHDALLLRRGTPVAHGPVRDVVTEAHLETLYPGAQIRVEPADQTGRLRVYFKSR